MSTAPFQKSDRWKWRSFVATFVLIIATVFCVAVVHAQSESDVADVTIPLTELANDALRIDQDDVQDDGSFEVLNTLRHTVLENGETYADWEELARIAKTEIAKAEDNTDSLDVLRRKLSSWRDLFLSKESVNQSRVLTIEGQISALSPKASSKGSSDTLEVAEIVSLKISALEKERAVLMVPSLAAAEAYELATGLIREIDRIDNARKRTQFLETSPSPILPGYWSEAFEYIYKFVEIIPAETRIQLLKHGRTEAFRNDLPRILFLGLIAGVIFLRSGSWIRSARVRVHNYGNRSLRWLALFLLSTIASIAPVIATFITLQVIVLFGIWGSHGLAVLSSLQWFAIFHFVSRWIGAKIFPREDVGIEIVQTTPVQRVEGRLYANLLGVILGISFFLLVVISFSTPEKGIEAVLFYPLILGTGLLSLRLARLFQNGLSAEYDDADAQEGRGFRNQIVNFASRLVMVPAVLGPLFATFGYHNAAVMITFPMIPSLALLGFVLIVQRLGNELYDVAVGREGAAREAIIPVLFGFFLTIISVPLFAIIVGISPAQIADYWKLFLNGFTFGTTRISPSNFLMFGLAFAAGYMITRLIQGALRSSLLPKTKLDIGGQNAIVSGIGYVGIFIAGLAAVMVAGIDLSAFAIVAGALSVGIGFGLQNIVSNFVSGIILLVERPISEGDWIETSDGQMGYVRDISVRSTRIETFDRTDVIIPNGDLVSGVVTNWTRGSSIGRLILPVGVSYDSDSQQVSEILLDVANAHPMILAAPAPSALFRGFGDSSLDFELRVILRDVNWKLSVESELNHEILKRFNEAKISIPFPQSDLWIRNPEDLHPQPPKSKKTSSEPKS